MMATRFEKCRFHIDFGPAELFARVHQKMDCVSSVSLHGKHFKTRLDERQIPAEVIADVKNFRSSDWNLVEAEVRADSGKFVNSSWEKEYDGIKYRVVIGFGNVAETIIRKNGRGTGKAVKEGPLYEYVKEINGILVVSEESTQI